MLTTPTRAVLLLLISTCAQAGALERLFAPKADLWSFWETHDNNSMRSVDHAAWDRFLARYLQAGPDGINRVSYATVSAEDRRALQAYLDSLEALPIRSYSRAEQLAYWLNLYNALTVELVLAHYPVASIRDIDISPGWFADGPWDRRLLQVEGEALSLNDIEHRILRPIWGDPRLHYALNCASLGCPNLQPEAYRADTVEAMLEQAAAAFVNHPRVVRVEDGRLYVSSIYSWFRSDFGGSDAGVLAHLRRYAAPELASVLARVERIAGDHYDWSLNDASPAH